MSIAPVRGWSCGALALALALVACACRSGSGVPLPPEPEPVPVPGPALGAIVARTGPPELQDEPFTPLLLVPVAEFEDLVERHRITGKVAAPTRMPEGLASDARFAMIRFGGESFGIVLEGDANRGFRIRADTDADGDLSDGPRLELEAGETGPSIMLWAGTGQLLATGKTSHRSPFGLTVRLGWGPAGNGAIPLTLSTTAVRRGTVEVEGRTLSFALVGDAGVYNEPHNVVCFDLDGDGQLAFAAEDSTENYRVEEGVLAIAGKGYRFEVERHGASLRLTPLDDPPPTRVDLRPGAEAPDFAFTDFEGTAHRLSDYRGRTVLLDFWGTWCAPCVAEVPRLVEARSRLEANGFEIIGIHHGGTREEVASFARESGMAWLQTIEIEGDRGPIHRAYRVHGWPTYVLVGEDGRILARASFLEPILQASGLTFQHR